MIFRLNQRVWAQLARGVINLINTTSGLSVRRLFMTTDTYVINTLLKKLI